MTKLGTILLAAAFFLPLSLRAEEAQDLSVSAQSEDPDVYYAPEETGEVSGKLGGSSGAVTETARASIGASSMSRARIVPFAWGSPDEPLKGAELFLNGQYLGKSPLQLESVLVSAKPMQLTANLEGYEEGVRPAVTVPGEGSLPIALLSESAAGWYTTPSWIVGLGLVAGSIAMYNNGNGSAGVAMLGGGVGLISLSQITARFFHMPALRDDVAKYNSQP